MKFFGRYNLEHIEEEPSCVGGGHSVLLRNEEGEEIVLAELSTKLKDLILKELS